VGRSGNRILRRLLEARRQETLRELNQRLRDAREEWTWTREVRDIGDTSELDGREDIELQLIRMKAETLRRIDEALTRLRGGGYGYCRDCETKIPETRLRALPFAARCRGCQELRERTGPETGPASPVFRASVSLWD
jgi:RNA polymerase-binding transcription factor